MSKDNLIIFDTTMRDGEQSPGASMTKDEKLCIARVLERMKGQPQLGRIRNRKWLLKSLRCAARSVNHEHVNLE